MMDDSCGDGNDSTVGFCDMSLGREILKMVRRNEQGGKSPMETDCGNKSYMDSSGDNSGIVDDYLDEAFDSDESDSDNEQKPNPVELHCFPPEDYFIKTVLFKIF